MGALAWIILLALSAALATAAYSTILRTNHRPTDYDWTYIAGGALLGGALASRPPPPPPVYYAPAPVYIEEPACRLVRERFWDGYGWQVRRVQVCD